MQSQTLDTIYLDDLTKSVFKNRSTLIESIDALDAEDQCTCRICLEKCPPIWFCQCSGGMMVHEQCLVQFLNVKIRTQKSQLNSQLLCEICHFEYQFEVSSQCSLSISQCLRKIGNNQTRCCLYSMFFLIVLVFYGYMGFLFVSGHVSDVVRIVLIIVAVCLSLMFTLFLGVWIHQYLFKVEPDRIVRIISLNQSKGRLFSTPTQKFNGH